MNASSPAGGRESVSNLAAMAIPKVTATPRPVIWGSKFDLELF